LKSRMNYVGPSMRPVFRPGDGLVIKPYRSGRIRVGDVVVFRPPGQRHHVVHRVVSLDSSGISTKGDGNEKEDAWKISPEDIVGRVESIRRGIGTGRVEGGIKGRIQGRLAGMLGTMDRMISRALHPVYEAMSGKFVFLVPVNLRNNFVIIKRPHGKDIHLLIGRHHIGHCPAGQSGWRIQRPFRLFVDEDGLPSPDEIRLNDSTLTY